MAFPLTPSAHVAFPVAIALERTYSNRKYETLTTNKFVCIHRLFPGLIEFKFKRAKWISLGKLYKIPISNCCRNDYV